MSRRGKATVLLAVVVFLLAATLGGAARRNGPERAPRPGSGTVTPSPYPHAGEATR